MTNVIIPIHFYNKTNIVGEDYLQNEKCNPLSDYLLICI